MYENLFNPVSFYRQFTHFFVSKLLFLSITVELCTNSIAIIDFKFIYFMFKFLYSVIAAGVPVIFLKQRIGDPGFGPVPDNNASIHINGVCFFVFARRILK